MENARFTFGAPTWKAARRFDPQIETFVRDRRASPSPGEYEDNSWLFTRRNVGLPRSTKRNFFGWVWACDKRVQL